jgi:hypothetical protein
LRKIKNGNHFPKPFSHSLFPFPSFRFRPLLMSSLSNLQPQQGYNNQQQPYHNYSQTTQHPPQNLGQRAGETSLAITKDPRFIAAIFSFFFALGFGYSVYQSFNFVGLIIPLIHVGILCWYPYYAWERSILSVYH